ncbi:MAG: TOPRIM nucleotidyl transferase/hydrolase domain-containing protein [Cyanobacteria bacterium P01_E01_bin.42]
MELKKIAIFVEGQTEQIFVEKLLNEIAGYNNISIQINIMGGSKTTRTIQKTKQKLMKDARFFALLYDCGNESSRCF